MNTTAIGNALEDEIFALFQSEIFHDRFWAKSECCKVFKQKRYHSNDRPGGIVFDVAIELYLPGESEYSSLVLIECKNYNKAVPVGDIEAFYQKIQQVSGAAVKGIMATRIGYQSGTLDFAKSKRCGLIRYFDRQNFQWVLKRSPSAGIASVGAERSASIEHALTEPDYRSECFDFYCYSTHVLTNSW